MLAADDIAEDYYTLSGIKYESGIDKETGERIEKATPYSRLEKEDQDHIGFDYMDNEEMNIMLIRIK